MNINGIEIEDLKEKYGTPLYIYDFDKIEENIEEIKQAFMFGKDRSLIYYAMKANPHPAILRLVKETGVGVDCVSPGEVEVALRAGIDPDNILYTGNYESKTDLKRVYNNKVRINLDSYSSFEKLIEIDVPEMISFRINPGEGAGKYKHITTGGELAKFGLPMSQTLMAYKSALEAGVQKFGAHTFLGSGILDEDHFPEVLELLVEEIKNVRKEVGIKFEFLDIGGGFGIPYYEENRTLDMQKTGRRTLQKLDELVNEYDLGNPKLAIEPGRYIVGNAGYLITNVTSVKESYRKYIGIDAGFNDLIRPALYGAEHSIEVDGKENISKIKSKILYGLSCGLFL